MERRASKQSAHVHRGRVHERDGFRSQDMNGEGRDLINSQGLDTSLQDETTLLKLPEQNLLREINGAGEPGR